MAVSRPAGGCAVRRLSWVLSLCAAVIAAPGAAAGDIRWTNVGPGGGGWITCLAADPTNADVIWAGCDVGGIYKSTDAGRSWQILNEGLTAQYVERIVIHPRQPRIVYAAGCGGVFKSVDGGRKWRWLRSGFPQPQEYRYSAPVGALAMDPSNPDVLYAGIGFPRKWSYGNGVVYKTIDAGESWTPLRGIAQSEPEACFFQIAVRPDRPATLLAATDKGLFRSDDAGASWRPVGNGLPGPKITDVAISPSAPDVVYATVWTEPGRLPWRGGVYRSTDGGHTFISVASDLPHVVGKPGEPHQKTCNFLKVAVDPRDHRHVYAAASSWVGAGLFMSTDAGEHWQRVTRRVQEPNMEMGWITMGGIPGIKCIAISPVRPDRVFIAGSMRLWRSDDGGRWWKQCFTREVRPGWWQGNGLETTCIRHMAIDPTDPDRIYFGYADVGLLVSEDGGHSFQRRVEGIPWHGDMAPVAIDPHRPNVLWCGMGKVRRGIGGVAKSLDYGRTWSVVGSPQTGLPNAPTPALVLDPSSAPDRRTLYVASIGHGIYKSTDGGATWHPASQGLPTAGPLMPRCIVLDPSNPRRVYVSLVWTRDNPLGGIYVSEDAGGSWRKVNERPELPDVMGLAIDPCNPSIIFAACRRHYDHKTKTLYPGGVYRSADGGRTWKLVLPDRFAACVLISPADSRIIYAGLTAHPYHDNCRGGGVMKSTDGGLTWRPENEGLTDTQVGIILCHPRRPEVLFAGTGGNGVFRGVDAGVAASP